MSSQVQDWVTWIVSGALFITILATIGIASIVTAMRPADEREALLRGVPPATEPMPDRMHQLRVRASAVARRYLIVIGPAIGLVSLVIAVASVSGDHLVLNAQAWLQIILAAAIPAVLWEVFIGVFLLAKYYSAKKRIILDARFRTMMEMPDD